MFSHHCLR
ncbi:hypothetical protein Aduo_014228 [Ancylostoma duodenale]